MTLTFREMPWTLLLTPGSFLWAMTLTFNLWLGLRRGPLDVDEASPCVRQDGYGASQEVENVLTHVGPGLPQLVADHNMHDLWTSGVNIVGQLDLANLVNLKYLCGSFQTCVIM